MNLLDDRTENLDYECINQTILDGNVMNIILIIIELNYNEIDADGSTCNGYYIIRFSLYTWTV